MLQTIFYYCSIFSDIWNETYFKNNVMWKTSSVHFSSNLLYFKFILFNVQHFCRESRNNYIFCRPYLLFLLFSIFWYWIWGTPYFKNNVYQNFECFYSYFLWKTSSVHFSCNSLYFMFPWLLAAGGKIKKVEGGFFSVIFRSNVISKILFRIPHFECW